MDVLAKKKAAPKPSKTAGKEGPLDAEARGAGDKKPGQAKGRKVVKRQPSSLDSDSDSDFGLKPSKSVAAKVRTLPPVRAKGGTRESVPGVLAQAEPLRHPSLLLGAGRVGEKGGSGTRIYPRLLVWSHQSQQPHLPRDTVLRFVLLERSLFLLRLMIHFLTMLFPPEIQAGRR